MAKTSKMFRLTQEAIDELEALSANDTHKYNETSVIEALIHQAYAARADHLKAVTAIRNDKGRTIGWSGSYEGRAITQTDGAGSKDECARRLDDWVREELSK